MNRQLLEGYWKEALAEKPYPDPRFPPSPYYRFMRILAQNLQPQLSVELGVCGGGGSFHLAIGWPQGKVVGVDLQRDYPENLSFIIEQCRNFEFWLGDSVESAKAIYEKHGKVDILFIDTIHTTERTIEEFEAWRPYLSDRVVVCFDDLLRFEMTGAWESLPEPKMRLDDLHPIAEGGFGVWWK